jgi:hypothetical protein
MYSTVQYLPMQCTAMHCNARASEPYYSHVRFGKLDALVPLVSSSYTPSELPSRRHLHFPPLPWKRYAARARPAHHRTIIGSARSARRDISRCVNICFYPLKSGGSRSLMTSAVLLNAHAITTQIAPLGSRGQVLHHLGISYLSFCILDVPDRGFGSPLTSYVRHEPTDACFS